MQDKQRNLGIVCEIPDGGFAWFRIQLYNRCGNCLCDRLIAPFQTEWMTVPARGDYELRISACPYSGVTPLGARRWMRLFPSGRVTQHFIFRQQPFECISEYFPLINTAYADGLVNYGCGR